MSTAVKQREKLNGTELFIFEHRPFPAQHLQWLEFSLLIPDSIYLCGVQFGITCLRNMSCKAHSECFILCLCRCIQTLIEEQLKKIRSTLADITTLDTATLSAEDHLNTLRASKRTNVGHLFLYHI